MIIVFQIFYLIMKSLINKNHLKTKNFQIIKDAIRRETSQEQIIVTACYHEKFGLKFEPPVYLQRYNTIVNILKNPKWNGRIQKIVDFGCSNMNFFTHLKRVPGILKVIEVDIDEFILNQYRYRVEPLISDYLNRRLNKFQVEVYIGSISQPDFSLIKMDVVIAIEVIEHLYPYDLEGVPHNIFGFIKPKIVIFTTPNSDFNVLFKNSNGFRHLDHKFEWSKQQFQDWCNNIIIRYPDFNVTFQDIGYSFNSTHHLGGCTQMALFTNKNYKTKSKFDSNLDNFKSYGVCTYLMNLHNNFDKDIKLAFDSIENNCEYDELVKNEKINYSRMEHHKKFSKNFESKIFDEIDSYVNVEPQMGYVPKDCLNKTEILLNKPNCYKKLFEVNFPFDDDPTKTTYEKITKEIDCYCMKFSYPFSEYFDDATKTSEIPLALLYEVVCGICTNEEFRDILKKENYELKKKIIDGVLETCLVYHVPEYKEKSETSSQNSSLKSYSDRTSENSYKNNLNLEDTFSKNEDWSLKSQFSSKCHSEINLDSIINLEIDESFYFKTSCNSLVDFKTYDRNHGYINKKSKSMSEIFETNNVDNKLTSDIRKLKKMDDSELFKKYFSNKTYADDKLKIDLIDYCEDIGSSKMISKQNVDKNNSDEIEDDIKLKIDHLGLINNLYNDSDDYIKADLDLSMNNLLHYENSKFVNEHQNDFWESDLKLNVDLFDNDSEIIQKYSKFSNSFSEFVQESLKKDSPLEFSSILNIEDNKQNVVEIKKEINILVNFNGNGDLINNNHDKEENNYNGIDECEEERNNEVLIGNVRLDIQNNLQDFNEFDDDDNENYIQSNEPEEVHVNYVENDQFLLNDANVLDEDEKLESKTDTNNSTKKCSTTSENKSLVEENTEIVQSSDGVSESLQANFDLMSQGDSFLYNPEDDGFNDAIDSMSRVISMQDSTRSSETTLNNLSYVSLNSSSGFEDMEHLKDISK